MVINKQLLTSAIGTLLNIDTYNQPRVESGKEILRDIFKHP